MEKLYIDGCSLVYGDGLPRDKSVGHLFDTLGGYTVTDLSRSGKSNLAIALDAYQNYKDYDLIILGFTYSSRFYIKYNDQNLDFYLRSKETGFGIDDAALDNAQVNVYKHFYTIFGHPYCDDLSDMVIDGLLSFLRSQRKKVIPFSWQQRKIVSESLHYPYISSQKRLPDGHLNSEGMLELYHYLQNINGKQ
jgi:hypothetical protein